MFRGLIFVTQNTVMIEEGQSYEIWARGEPDFMWADSPGNLSKRLGWGRWSMVSTSMPGTARSGQHRLEESSQLLCSRHHVEHTFFLPLFLITAFEYYLRCTT